MKKLFSRMKRIIALLIVFGMVAGLVPAPILGGIASAAEPDDHLELNNGYIQVTVSEKNGGFGIRTIKGDKVNKSDNDKYLVYAYDGDNTSFTSFQLTRNGVTKEYIFGGKYPGSSGVTVSGSDSEITASWSVDDLTIRQSITLANSGSTEHGAVLLTYTVENSGEAADVKCRILMDTAMGYQDYAYYQVGKDTHESEVVLGENGYEKSFYALNDPDDPTITAYTINASVDNRECKPYKTIFAHWNNLASTVFDYTPDPDMTFTNFQNVKYLTSDSAYAQYFDLGRVEKDQRASAATNYGVYSNESMDEQDTVSVNVNAPDVLQFADAEQTAYENGGRFQVKTHIRNIAPETYSDICIVVTTAGCISALDQEGNPPQGIGDGNYSMRITDVTPGEQLDIDWNFVAQPQEVGQYSRIHYKVYDVSDEATSNTGTLMLENLLGEGYSYILCPGSVEQLPRLKFTGASPDTIFTSGIRSFHVTGENFSMLLDKSAYTMKISRVDGMKVNGQESFQIPGDQFSVDDSVNVISIVLNDEHPGKLPEGQYQITLDYLDPGMEDLSGSALRFHVSDDERYKNETYGFLAVVRDDQNNYSIEKFYREDIYWDWLQGSGTEREKDAAENANANLSFDESTKTAYLSVAFGAADPDVFGKTWDITTMDGAQLVVYDVLPMPTVTVDEVQLSGNTIHAQLGGYRKEAFTRLTIVAEGKNSGEVYLLGGAQDPFASGAASLDLNLPEHAVSDTYDLRIICTDDDAQYYQEATAQFAYTNPNQPKAPTGVSAENAGDYMVAVSAAAEGAYDGFRFTVRDAQGSIVSGMSGILMNKDGSLVQYDEQGMLRPASGESAASFLIGGCFQQTVLNTEGQEERITTGLNAGDYTIEIRTWKKTANGSGILVSAPAETAITVREPVKTQILVQANAVNGMASVKQTMRGSANDPYQMTTFADSSLNIRLSSDAEAFTGTWRIDGGFREDLRGEITEATNQFTMQVKDLAEGQHSLTFRGSNGYYISDVSLLAAEGYELVDENGSAQIVISAEGEHTATFRIRRLEDGAMTDLIQRTVKIDRAAPDGSVTVENNTWMELLNTITFGLFFNKTQQAEIAAEDPVSGMASVEYVISGQAMTGSELKMHEWNAYTEPVSLDADGQYVVYAKLTDRAGNITYLSSDGMVIDTVAPVVSGIEDGGTYVGEVIFTIVEEYIDYVSINGVPVTGVQHKLKPMDDVQTIVVRDKAGNETVLNVLVTGCAGGEDCPSLGFVDLDPDAWYHLSVDYVLRNGLMQGYGNRIFAPGDRLSRAMIVQVLYNLENRPEVSDESAYTDVSADMWYTDAIIWATQNGIINGYGNGQYGPDNPVTREQMAAIFYRYSSFRGYSLTEGSYDHFTDRDAVAGYAEQAMRWAVGKGLLMGREDGTLCPSCHTNRAEFATVIQRFCETIAK